MNQNRVYGKIFWSEKIPTLNNKAKRCLGLFAKDPFAANAKTRLGPTYNIKFRQGLANAFLKDMVHITSPLYGVSKVLNYSPPQSADRMEQHLPPQWSMLVQEGDDLGQKMEFFFHWAFLNDFTQAVLIGSDFPTLPPQFIKNAFELLQTFPVVLGPSTDGGYYLIGLSRPHPEIFRNIDWSSEKVFSQTVERLKENIGLLPPWYDVDHPEDVAMLAGHLRGILKTKTSKLPPHTLRFLQQHKLV